MGGITPAGAWQHPPEQAYRTQQFKLTISSNPSSSGVTYAIPCSLHKRRVSRRVVGWHGDGGGRHEDCESGGKSELHDFDLNVQCFGVRRLRLVEVVADDGE